MDDRKEFWMEKYRKKYEKIYNAPKFKDAEDIRPKFKRPGGIFTKKTRDKILGNSRISGRDSSIADFRYNIRETVKTGLIDLQLFMEVADEKDVNKVITEENFGPLIKSLFSISREERLRQIEIVAEQNKKEKILDKGQIRIQHSNPKSDNLLSERPKIAQLLIASAFEYLRENSRFLSQKTHQEIIDAIELSNELTLQLLPDSEKKSFYASGMRNDLNSVY